MARREWADKLVDNERMNYNDGEPSSFVNVDQARVLLELEHARAVRIVKRLRNAGHIRLDDEAAGLFVVLEQSPSDKGTQRIALDVEEWPHIQRAVQSLIETCRARNAKEGTE